MTQRELGRVLGLAPSRVSERWRGITPWALEDIEAVAHLFGMDPAELCRSVDCPVALTAV
jgi:transcriptional regulator with XRE-family HTH domain